MLAGIPYSEAVKVVHPRRRKGDGLGTTRRKLLNACRRLGFVIRERQYVDLPKLHNPAILGVDAVHPAFAPFRHAVVWDPSVGKVLDPYPSPNRPLKRHLSLRTYQRGLIEVFEIVARCTRRG